MVHCAQRLENAITACGQLALNTTASTWDVLVWAALILPRLMASASYQVQHRVLKALLGPSGAKVGDDAQTKAASITNKDYKIRLHGQREEEELMAEAVRSLQAQYDSCRHSLNQLSVAYEGRGRRMQLLTECECKPAACIHFA